MCITKHLVNLQERIRLAAAACNRNENEVSILAASKGRSARSINAAYEAGLHSMGENYVQEALVKIPQCNPAIEWHFIGEIQSNKTRAIAEHFHWVQTVSNERIARRLNNQRPDGQPTLNVCVQVCTDKSFRHGGVSPEAAADLCAAITELPRLRLRGLMTVPLPAHNQPAQRKPLRLLHKLYDEMLARGFDLDTLSMGMSNDLEAAVAEGSTLLRIGTALFGSRPE